MSNAFVHFLDLSLPTAAENVALDEALLLEAEAGRLPPVLRVWEQAGPAVVIGSGSRLQEEVNVETCCAEDMPIVRRCSGGGAVVLGRGCLCYSLILPSTWPGCGDVRTSVSCILATICDALEALNINVSVRGGSDLVHEGRKIGGSGQRRMLRSFLHHGTLLYGIDVALMERYLRIPKRQPDYRQGRGHRDFVANLACSAEVLKKTLRETWKAEAPLESWPEAETQHLVQVKYNQDAWTYRR